MNELYWITRFNSLYVIFGRSYTHYLYKGVVYKSKSKFLDAIKDLKFNHLFLKSNERRSNVNSSSEK